MTSLNRSVAHSPDGNTLSMFEYYQLLESSVYAQQAETGSYDPIKVVTSKKATSISGNLSFQVSTSSRFEYHLYHSCSEICYLSFLLRFSRIVIYHLSYCLSHSNSDTHYP
jgi:hypothetical protein